jgi:hypothetical protein
MSVETSEATSTLQKLKPKWTGIHNIIIIIIIITMAQQPYMGSGLLLPPLSKVTKSCAFVAVGDWPTGRATVLSILMCLPEPSGRQSGDG